MSLPAIGTALLWAMSSTSPRIQQLYADEVLPQPAAPLAVDEGVWEPPFSVRQALSLIVEQTQDERPTPIAETYGDPIGTPPDLWAMSTGRPRITILPADDGIVAQPQAAPPDDGDWQPGTVVARDVWGPVPWQYGAYEGALWSPVDELYQYVPLVPVPRTLDLTVHDTQDEKGSAQAPLSVDDDAGFTSFRPVESVWMPVPWQYGYGEGISWSPISEDYDHQLYSVPRRAVQPPDPDTDSIVEQPQPFRLTEGEWEAPYSVLQTRSLFIAETQDERVEQPTPLAIEEGEWTPPFVAIRVLCLEVHQWQDERRLVADADEAGWLSARIVTVATMLGDIESTPTVLGTLAANRKGDAEP